MSLLILWDILPLPWTLWDPVCQPPPTLKAYPLTPDCIFSNTSLLSAVYYDSIIVSVFVHVCILVDRDPTRGT